MALDLTCKLHKPVEVPWVLYVKFLFPYADILSIPAMLAFCIGLYR